MATLARALPIDQPAQWPSALDPATARTATPGLARWQLSLTVVLDGQGRLVGEVKVPSEPEALVLFLGSLGLVFERIGLEAGSLCRSGCMPGSSAPASPLC